jgi:hypothetical protein
MLKLELQSAAVAWEFTAFAFTTRLGLSPLHSHFRLTPWSVFQDGSSVHATLDNILRYTTLALTRSNVAVETTTIPGENKWCRAMQSASCSHWVMDSRFPLSDFRYFNSPFEVLFNFPSRYLFTIDLSPLSSHGWRLPPFLRSTPKERDSRS